MTDNASIKAIQALETEFATLFNVGNHKRLAETFYTEDARLLPQNEPTVAGREAILGYLETMGAGFSGVRVTPGTVVVSGDLAIAHGAYRATITTPDGRKVEDVGKFVEGWRRENGAWKCFVDTFTSDRETR